MVITIRNYRHDGSSSPVYGSAPSVRRGGMGAPGPIVTEPPSNYARGYSHPQHSAAVVTTPSLFANPLPPQDCQPAIPAHFAVHQSAAAIVRDQRRRDLIASIAEFWRASGPDRTYWRRDARHRLAEWRRLHVIPEKLAFDAAVARSRA